MRHLFPLLLTALVVQGPAQAGEEMVVKVHDLHLSTTAGAYLAIQRMNDAALAFCASRAADGGRTMDVTTLKCRRDMAARATRLLNHSNVTARQANGGAVLLAIQR